MMKTWNFTLSMTVVVVWATAFSADTNAKERNYCGVKDFIEVCLKQDQSAFAIGKQMAAKGWGIRDTSDREPTLMSLGTPQNDLMGFSVSEVTYSDSYIQNCVFDYWRQTAFSITAHCRNEELALLDNWLEANNGEKIAETRSPDPKRPKFTHKGISKIWKFERGDTRVKVKMTADELDEGKPLVNMILVAEKVFLRKRPEE